MSEPQSDVSARDLRDLFHPLYTNQRERVPLTSHPDVLDLGNRPRNPEGADISDIGDDPLIVLFAARSSSKIAEIKSAFESGSALHTLQQDLDFDPGDEKPLREAIDNLIEEPVYAEFRYAEFRLADAVHVPAGKEVTAYAFPYSGGRLDPHGFTLTQWRKDDKSPTLEALIVHNSPPRSDAEAQAASNAPGVERVVVHPERWCDTTWVTVAGGVGSFTAAAAAAGPTPGAFDVADLGEDVLRRFEGEPTLEELLDMRVDLLGADIHPFCDNT